MEGVCKQFGAVKIEIPREAIACRSEPTSAGVIV
jgi:hypothetical protein